VPLDVAVQIVNYNTREHLATCLEALGHDLEGSPLQARVLVLDNASDDDLSELEERWNGQVEFQRSPRNVGFGAAQNLLAGQHDARALLFLNPDTVMIESRTIERLLAVLTAESGVAAVGPQLLTEGRTVHYWDHGESRGFGARLAAAAGSSHHRIRHERGDVAWVSGASALVLRRHFDAVGGFDPGFFLYKEDEDLFARIRANGGRVVYEPSVRVLHLGSVTGARGQYAEASVRRFRRKHIRSRVQRAVLPLAYEGWVRLEGGLRRRLRERTWR
jgi:N-acetylglucosaminyl-diphospho-decaprenol L-rhamnosyltransferase